MASQTHGSGNQVVTQTAILRAMTIEQRWRVAQNLYASAREWKACVLRSLHPEWSEAEVRESVRRHFSRAG